MSACFRKHILHTWWWIFVLETGCNCYKIFEFFISIYPRKCYICKIFENINCKYAHLNNRLWVDICDSFRKFWEIVPRIRHHIIISVVHSKNNNSFKTMKVDHYTRFIYEFGNYSKTGDNHKLSENFKTRWTLLPFWLSILKLIIKWNAPI